jgi:hypothetical protein
MGGTSQHSTVRDFHSAEPRSQVNLQGPAKTPCLGNASTKRAAE